MKQTLRTRIRNRWHELYDAWRIKIPGQGGEGVFAIALGITLAVVLLALLINWPVKLRG